MLRRLIVVLAAIVAAVAFAPTAGATDSSESAASLAPEVAAPAEPAASTCEPGYLCFWTEDDYQGAKGKVAGNNKWWGAFSQPACPRGTWNDCAQSAKNRGTSCTAIVYSDVDYGGARHPIERGGNRPILWYYGWNRVISSNSWC
ncbi:peptidase inhibitor family I36 protein [Tenggerimyces flavus]|uniref:Peptidase inhibitor family I36 protein n=1 Tax=Tenggerimyces flavus TaxID=1708749 RepID=A0ABV7Y708_9ACTN|nr:peptidase inhibitor family I36 protein [Tenggerimyces flavus]MBM7788296.1 hypothetical protein [Tenggerimyces flavus]